MKRIIWLCTFSMLPCWYGSQPVMAGDCLLIDWNTVTGGSHISTLIEVPGICEYEIDFHDLQQPVLLQTNLSNSFAPSLAHEVQLVLDSSGFDQNQKGGFRVMSLNAGSRIGPLFTLDLFWANTRQSKDILVLKGNPLPVLQRNPWQTSTSQSGANSVSIPDGLTGVIQMTIRFFESSSPGLNDGIIELWVDDHLEATWTNLALDWSISDAPISVSYGVIRILEQQTSGTLNMLRLQPSPSHSTF